MSEDIIEPLTKLSGKPRPGRPKRASHFEPYQIERLCRVLASDLKEKKKYEE